ncbi:hypothetical protein AN6103.2 [Aspergillus nidulans FGSC A4]|uniref:Lytic polysaccharide monooxygenase aasB n=1 Tax=Emericella nidulans (strain FGSC A4 / ATCC 38163 / CBS 112.46 / NRRL 194 / M139) TaxID=227321 RepID=AASB_EMENI|nr:hypothetical protein [Aspergillus nidulans FGSC A4]EAA58078.1 hypothetical protein AN6103.2 [Aspergillus nidulans FGSC A4]CBF70179.1 TPA: conserved hypothetical protein [Aspergillus nidulans FGSC A4]|eukprot:XP_663707.1 hypothetical protein AN6103.2 [Aspergillus nidulans FGSC A4]
MKAFFAISASTLLATVHGHGYLTVPASRTRLGFEAGIDTCPECSILEPVDAWPNVTEAQVGRSGPCGYNARVSVDYNQPGDNWGNEPVVTYKAGDIVEVQWCVDNNGDHGGMFTYGICQDQELVDKFLDPDYLPTEEEKQAAEDCFLQGELKCGDVDGQECEYSPDCGEGEACYRNDWFTCNAFEADSDRGCQGVDGAELNSCKTTIAGGYTVTKKIKIPDYTSEHTLLRFRWNSFQTPQIYLHCADPTIEGGMEVRMRMIVMHGSFGVDTQHSFGHSFGFQGEGVYRAYRYIRGVAIIQMNLNINASLLPQPTLPIRGWSTRNIQHT